MGCGHGCVRALMIIFNSIFMLVAIGLVGVGIWITVAFQQFAEYLPPELADNKTYIQGTGIAICVIGGFVIFQAALGCIGAWRESKCLLSLFFIVMFVIFAVVVACAVVILVKQEWVQQLIQMIMTSETDNKVDDGLLSIAHASFNCCGIVDETFCSKNYPPMDVCKQNSTLCTYGCFDPVWNKEILPYLDVGVGILFSLSVIVAIGAIFSMCLCCSIRRRDESYGYHHHHDDAGGINSDYKYMKD